MLEQLRQTLLDACQDLSHHVPILSNETCTNREGTDVQALVANGYLYVWEASFDPGRSIEVPAFHIDLIPADEGATVLTPDGPISLQETVHTILSTLLDDALAGWFAAREEEEEDGSHDYYEDMDGDHASALASAGFGTDEDYGCYESGLEEG